MATLTASPVPRSAPGTAAVPKGEIAHRILLTLAALGAACMIVFLIFRGYAYYSLPLEERPLSPLHGELRSSGSIGLKLGFLSIAMFGALFLYPVRKRWRWLGRIGSTRRWLNFHVLLGLSTPVIVTFHTAFKCRGLAGLAYWTMISVAVSGLVGRYVYAKIPRSIHAVKLTVTELEAQTASLSAGLEETSLLRAEDLAPLLKLPPLAEIRAMNLLRALWILLRMDLMRPLLISRLRRRGLRGSQKILTLGGILASHNQDVESILSNVKRQSRLCAAMAFLDRTERVFHLWHVIHRPFSISFVVLIAVHIGVALSVGF